MKYAYFTVGLPESTPEEVVALLKKHGYRGVEWRMTTDDGDTSKPGFWSGNKSTLQESWPDSRFKEIAEITRDAGLEVPNLGSYARAGEPDRAARAMAAARILGAPSLRVNVQAYDGARNYNGIFDEELSRYEKIVAMGREHGVRPLIEIHMNTILPSASAAFRFVSHFKPGEIGVIHDAGNMVYEGFENYQAGIELLGPYLAHVHVKNAMPVSAPVSGGLKWNVVAARLRQGMADMRGLMTALKASGYSGWLAFEDFFAGAPQEEKVKDNIAYLKEIGVSLK